MRDYLPPLLLQTPHPPLLLLRPDRISSEDEYYMYARQSFLVVCSQRSTTLGMKCSCSSMTLLLTAKLHRWGQWCISQGEVISQRLRRRKRRLGLCRLPDTSRGRTTGRGRGLLGGRDDKTIGIPTD